MTAVTTKRRMYDLLARGAFGHTLPSVETVEEAERFVAGGGAFAVRSKAAGGPCKYGLNGSDAVRLAASLPAGSWNLSPMLSDPHRVCYGHLYERPGGWHLHYTEAKKPSRLSFSQDGCEQLWLTGLSARLYLRRLMDQRGWDTLTDLVDLYPDHVIEFTVMDSAHAAWGPSNTIFWEVRTDSGEYEGPTWGH